MNLILLPLMLLGGHYIWVWLRGDWDDAMRTPAGRLMTSAGRRGRQAAGLVAERQRRQAGIALQDHTGTRSVTEVIDIEHGKDRALRTVVVCSTTSSLAYERVRGGLRPGRQITRSRPQPCDIRPDREHHRFAVRSARLGAR